MGLLDDAIREHLELKRRRGADPGEIARAEHEALEPIFPEEEVAGDGAVAADEASSLPGSAELEADGEDGAQLDSAGYEESADFANVGQETAELDMQAVLEADGEYSPPHAPAASARPVRAGAQLPQEDSSTWDAPGRSEREAVPEEVPGQERMSFE